MIFGGIGFAVYEIEKSHHNLTGEKQKKRIMGESRQKLKNYIEMTRKDGFSKPKIKKRLLEEGWQKELIDDIMRGIR